MAFPPHVTAKLKASRPDVVAAIERRDAAALKTRPEVLGPGFLRESLKKFKFPGVDPFAPVTLFRGVDVDSVDFTFSGEKNLVWTTTEPIDAVEYALNGRALDLRRASVIKYVVPKFMVYERSGSPVLRLEDVVDQRPFVDSVATLRINRQLAAFVEANPGERRLWLNYLTKKMPGLLEGTSSHWRKGDATLPPSK